jgi:aryl-alcohol dehydrogenase-like predicted oxidoreductase
MQTRGVENIAVKTSPADLGRATVSQDESQNRPATSRFIVVNIIQGWNYIDLATS